MIKLSKLSRDLGVTRVTLWNWMHQGKIQFHKIGGHNFVDQETYDRLTGTKKSKEESVIIYCRVSSSENKSNLETQKNRLIAYCNAKGYKVSRVVTEIASGLNDNRPKLVSLLREQNFTKIVVEHKDRLTRFGFNYIETLLSVNNIAIEVVNPIENQKDDIIQDFVSIVTSFCARLYGQRRGKRKTEAIVKEIEDQNIEKSK